MAAMASPKASPSHRSTMSVSTTNLAPPGLSPGNKQRRMTSPSLPPPPSPLNLPEPVHVYRRPPSPLRNGFTLDPNTGELSEDGSTHQSEESDLRQWGQRAHSPTPSVSQFATNFAQKVGSLMSNMSQPRSPNYHPTDEEIETEAERQREHSRREAERIMSREAETRRLEERVLAMLNADGSSPRSLPPPPSRSQSIPGTPPSPSSSKEGWWTIAKSKLTPTKESLTPAQQIIQDSKTRDKHIEKEMKELEKELAKEKKEMEKEMKKHGKKTEKQKSKDWPSSPENKYQDPAFIKLGAPSGGYPPRQMSASPSSPTPAPARRGIPSTPPSLAASPLRSNEAGSSSPSRQAPPLYAQFNSQGTLDVPGTLLTIAQRFEKLERWTVGHVRALEERMDDVERWLVEKEKEKEEPTTKSIDAQMTGEPTGAQAMSELREELAEVQGRIGELGREMAKLVTAPGNLSSGPSRTPASLGRAPSTTSSIAVRSISSNMPRGATPPKTKEPSSPPITTPAVPSAASRTRLPYPTGDYATPPDSGFLSQGPFSPTNSPPSSLTAASKARHLSISGLPSQAQDSSLSSDSPSGLPTALSPPTSPPQTLPPPSKTSSFRQSSVSPTPRKRYTVALGGPIMSASDRDRERPSTPHSRNSSRELGTAFFSTSPISTTPTDDDDHTDNSDGANEETIGRAAARHVGLTVPSSSSRNGSSSPSTSPRSSPSGNKRARPQSMYSGPAMQNILAPTPTTPLNTRLRSRSTVGLGIVDSTPTPITPSAGKFVDPLLIRRQTKEALASTAPPAPKVLPGKPKVPVGQLVAFFDQEK